ncbi:MAG: hypothetical protein JXA03_15490 [Bacteroidales bacterium]|nr:hypothetical protein [Bacteroidales bacterium]
MNIYEGIVDVKKQIEPNLFKNTLDALNISVDKGFGSVEFGSPDFDFVNELKYNNAVFSAFKVHREQNDIALRLLDKDGNLKSFSQFRKDAEFIDATYRRWLDTEYNTAILRARAAANFRKFVRDSDLYPNLKWLESTSADKREGHVKFYGLVKPIGDPFWEKHYPGNLWNCKCGITNTDEKADKNTPQADYEPAPGLEKNPALTGALFTKNNAYEKNTYPGAGRAVARTTKSIKANLKEYNRFGKDYTREGFDFATGGYWVSNKKHQFDPNLGFHERRASDILFKSGNKVVLQKEVSGNKWPEGLLNNTVFEIKTILGTGRNTIKRALQSAESKNARIAVLYFPDKELFTNKRLNDGIILWKKYTNYSFERIIYIVNDIIFELQ